MIRRDALPQPDRLDHSSRHDCRGWSGSFDWVFAWKAGQPDGAERTERGRADAKAKGVQFGCKPKLTRHQQREAIKRRAKDAETLRSIGRNLNVSAATISRLAP